MATVKLDPAKGVQIPNMTTTERDAVSSPETGAIIWNTTTSAVNQYNGSAWKEVLNATDLINISDSGTTGTKIAVGTTAQRGSTAGQWRFNSTTGFFEGYTGTVFATVEPTPTVTSVDDTEVDSAAGGNQTIVVTGTNFTAGGVIAFVGSSAEFDAATTTYNSATQVTAVAPKSSFLNAQEPYSVKFTSATGLSGTSSSGLINVDNDPVWSTAAGNLADVAESATITNIQLAATDADGDAVTYSETTSNLSGAGLALSSAGVISGTTGAVGSHTTTSFTVRATANSKTTDRAFNVITRNMTTSALLFDATLVNNEVYYRTGLVGGGTIDVNGAAISGISTAVTFTNIQGASGNLAHLNLVDTSTRINTHYNLGSKTIGDTFWSLSQNSHEAARHCRQWGMYSGTANNEYDTWITFDAGASPSFKLRKITGTCDWDTGSADLIIYGTNNISALGATTFSATNLTTLDTINNPGSTWDTGYWTGDFYRYYVLRLVKTSGTSYDYALDYFKWYGDYY